MAIVPTPAQPHLQQDGPSLVVLFSLQRSIFSSIGNWGTVPGTCCRSLSDTERVIKEVEQYLLLPNNPPSKHFPQKTSQSTRPALCILDKGKLICPTPGIGLGLKSEPVSCSGVTILFLLWWVPTPHALSKHHVRVSFHHTYWLQAKINK
jgi:hypothetical protein